MGVNVMSKGNEANPIALPVPLLRYDAACAAIAQARSVDEAKDIRDLSVALAAYARQAKNRAMEADAIEIRLRAERRLGQMIESQRDTVGLSAGTRGSPVKGARVDEKPTLADTGIDKNLAQRARTAERMEVEEFEAHVEEARAEVEAYRSLEKQLHRPNAPVRVEAPADGIARNYGHLVALLTAERNRQGIAQERFDDIAGFQDGYCGKLERPEADAGRSAVNQSFDLWIGGLKVGLRVVPL